MVILSATARVASDMVKDPANLLDTTVRRSAVAWENLKPNQKSEKSHLYPAGQWFITYKFFKDFTNHRKKD